MSELWVLLSWLKRESSGRQCFDASRFEKRRCHNVWPPKVKHDSRDRDPSYVPDLDKIKPIDSSAYMFMISKNFVDTVWVTLLQFKCFHVPQITRSVQTVCPPKVDRSSGATISLIMLRVGDT